MQSGIKATADLQSAFKSFLTSSSPALLLRINAETITLDHTLPDTTDAFPFSLPQISSSLPDRNAAYAIIRILPASDSSSASTLLAVTYTPDAAPVREKMLYASTRLSLIRELGTEHFGETLFVTTKEELTPEGWARHVRHKETEAPLTESEREGERLRAAEASGDVGGTGRREGHYVSAADAGAGGMELPLKTGEGVVEGLEGIREGKGGDVLVLKMRIPGEELEVDRRESGVDAGAVQGLISGSDPRYTFYNLEAGGHTKAVFIYTCPAGSKVKERMVYASSRSMVVKLAESKVGIKLDKKLEGSGPDDFPADVLRGEFAEKTEEKKGFARPKRPGRR